MILCNYVKLNKYTKYFEFILYCHENLVFFLDHFMFLRSLNKNLTFIILQTN